MKRYFTHYWGNDTWNGYAIPMHEKPLSHTAGNLFRKRGVKPGDAVYVVSVIEGKLFLGGRIDVDDILSDSEARRYLGTSDLWQASDHVVMPETRARPFTPFNVIPVDVVKRLMFLGKRGDVALKFRSEEHLDQQTLRGVRELSIRSAQLLDEYVKADPRS